MPASIILDLSRLLSRVLHPTPTGVDRVEMAYARELIRLVPDRLQFAAVHPAGIYGRLPLRAVLQFLDHTERQWDTGGKDTAWTLRRSAIRNLNLLRPRPVRPDGARERRIYLQASPHHLTKPMLVDLILQREAARFVCLIHDLIPLQYPEYARPDGAAQHQLRMETIITRAAGIVANSHDTLAALRPWLDRAGATPRLAVAHLGVEALGSNATGAAAAEKERPYFLCIGTIEPRKNHLLLLNIWRRMAEEAGGRDVPRLIVIGRRGWENEQIVDMLDRCSAIQDHVEERNNLSDQEIQRLLAGARALLVPSFAEGYGMPVTEALGAGVPVLCSDIAALREAGENVPDFLDPLDGPGWLRMIRDYAKPSSVFRRLQMERMTLWKPTSWTDHLQIVQGLIEEVAQ
jgi:glycosyltransferase involved in cell wall biosynthesis